MDEWCAVGGVVSERVVKVPDVGEGVAEAELVEWHVSVGDVVTADQTLADVMTDKATVEIPAPVAGTVTWRAGEPGDVLAVGSELVRIATDAGAGSANGDTAAPEPSTTAPTTTEPATEAANDSDAEGTATPDSGASTSAPSAAPTPAAPSRSASAPPRSTQAPTTRSSGVPGDAALSAPRPLHDVTARPQAAPAVRLRARTAGIDLRFVPGTGPGGRVTHDDLDRYAADTTIGRAVTSGSATVVADDTVDDIKLIGLRKRIAQRMAQANRIPHISYVDEVDLTLLQQLRESLNAEAATAGRPRLTVLPFLVGAIVEAVREHPTFNAHFDDSAGNGTADGMADGTGTLRVHHGVHVGIATQTDNGLLVPVLRHAETLDLFQIAAEIERLATAARDGSATSAELSGSTITITSLGALGGLATTPIINHPEVAIVGVNKLQTRPMWDGSTGAGAEAGRFVPRQMMNLSSSFDHRIVDGWDAAQFVQVIRRRLESPAPLLIGPR